MTFDVDAFGAKADGKTNDGEAIQRAIDACEKNGGGRVCFSGGKTYLSGSLELKTNVELYLESGSILRAWGDLSAYRTIREGQPAQTANVPSYVNCEFAGKPYQVFLYAKDAKNITISGQGTIDGNEAMYHGERSPYHIEGSYYPRVPMLLLIHVNHLTIRDITLTGSGFWTVQPVGCDDVLIDGVRILNNLQMANCDGLDPDHCKNVRIQNCHIECGDDCIVLKNTKDFCEYGDSENIVISNCTLISTSAAIKFGTESEQDFRNVLITNCAISKSHRGISLQLRDGGNIENVSVNNVTIETRGFSKEWWGSAEPICITALDRKEGVKAGHIRRISFRDITCVGENGILLYGQEGNEIEDVTFSNISITLRKNSKWTATGYDLRPNRYKEREEAKRAGLYARHAKDITVERLRVIAEPEMKEYYSGETDII